MARPADDASIFHFRETGRISDPASCGFRSRRREERHGAPVAGFVS